MKSRVLSPVPTSYGLKKFMGREYMGMMRHTFVVDAEGKLELIYRKVKSASMADDILNDLGLSLPVSDPPSTASRSCWASGLIRPPGSVPASARGASPPHNQSEDPTALLGLRDQPDQAFHNAAPHRLCRVRAENGSSERGICMAGVTAGSTVPSAMACN